MKTANAFKKNPVELRIFLKDVHDIQFKIKSPERCNKYIFFTSKYISCCFTSWKYFFSIWISHSLSFFVPYVPRIVLNKRLEYKNSLHLLLKNMSKNRWEHFHAYRLVICFTPVWCDHWKSAGKQLATLRLLWEQ